MNQTNFKKRKKQQNNFSHSNFGKQKHSNQSFRSRNKYSGINIDPEWLIKRADVNEEKKYLAIRTINEMPLHESIKKNLAIKGYIHPTEIQDKTLELLLEGNNLLGIAQTGTGKTGAFLIPVINRLISSEKKFKTLVIVPTRELALQVEKEFISIVKGLGLHSACFIGGTSLYNDLKKLKMMNHLVVGTPGRLLDLEKRNALQLKSFSVLVVDEFDRLFDMGFLDDVKSIVKSMINRKQTLLFSATKEKSQQSFINELIDNQVEVKIGTGKSVADNIDQDIIRIKKDENKFQVLLEIIGHEDFEKVLLFAETKHTVDHLYIQLKKSGIRVEQIHGDKSQKSRQIALEKFRDGKIKVLVATDVAARGLDVIDITHVINYQLPKTYENYIHRIGRTGRAGKSGNALTFVN